MSLKIAVCECEQSNRELVFVLESSCVVKAFRRMALSAHGTAYSASQSVTSLCGICWLILMYCLHRWFSVLFTQISCVYSRLYIFFSSCYNVLIQTEHLDR